MIVLGKTADDKGTQLERLVADLLKNMGYVNVILNKVGSGGEELDISAEFPVPSLGGDSGTRLLGECKAHKRPIDIPAWLKFLGKVFVEECQTGSRTTGCLIALSGVNGNCQGAYESLRAKRKDISIIADDALRDLLQKVHPFVDEATATRSIRRFTSRTIRLLDIAYYQRAVYWVIGFSDGTFSLLGADGTLVESKTVRTLVRLLRKSEALGTYVDLAQEEAARLLARKANAAVIGTLLIAGGQAERTAIYAKGDLTDQLLGDTIERLKAAGVISEAGGRLALPDPESADYGHLAEMYRMLIGDPLPVDCIGVACYDRYINDKLLDHILSIQLGVPLTAQERERATRLLRLSPGALAVCLRPIEVITNGRQSPVSLESIDRAHADVLFQTMHGYLQFDFRNPGLAAYFLNVRNMVELDTKYTTKLKSPVRVEMEDEIRVRTRLGEMVPEGEAGTRRFAVMRAFNEGPEPWEFPGPPQQDGAQSD